MLKTSVLRETSMILGAEDPRGLDGRAARYDKIISISKKLCVTSRGVMMERLELIH